VITPSYLNILRKKKTKQRHRCFSYFRGAGASSGLHSLGIFAKVTKRDARRLGTYLLYLLVIYVGLMGLFTAYYHSFRPIEASACIGWQSSPYENEVDMRSFQRQMIWQSCKD
jgi:hypothetical protein